MKFHNKHPCLRAMDNRCKVVVYRLSIANLCAFLLAWSSQLYLYPDITMAIERALSSFVVSTDVFGGAPF